MSREGKRKWKLEFAMQQEGEPSELQLRYENSALILEVRAGRAKLQFLDALQFGEAERRGREFLRSWEADGILQTTAAPAEFYLIGYSAPGLGRTATLEISASVGGPLARANTRRYEPWRLSPFEEDSLISGLIRRYNEAKAGKEKSLVMAYFCLSALQHAFQGRKRLTTELGLKQRDVTRLAQLVSSVGDIATARKIGGDQHDLRPPSVLEEHFVLTTVREMIFRAGRHRHQSVREGTGGSN